MLPASCRFRCARHAPFSVVFAGFLWLVAALRAKRLRRSGRIPGKWNCGAPRVTRHWRNRLSLARRGNSLRGVARHSPPGATGTQLSEPPEMPAPRENSCLKLPLPSHPRGADTQPGSNRRCFHLFGCLLRLFGVEQQPNYARARNHYAA